MFSKTGLLVTNCFGQCQNMDLDNDKKDIVKTSSHGSSTEVVYYSDLGLEEQRALRPLTRRTMHRARIKSLLLLSDAIYVPMSHLLNLSMKDFESIVHDMSPYVGAGMLRSKYSVNAPTLDDYAESFKSRIRIPDEQRELNAKIAVLREAGNIGGTAGGLYDGAQQIAQFNEHMRALLEARAETGALRSDIAPALSILDGNCGKELFDSELARYAGRLSGQDQALVRELSDYLYYYVGAETNEACMSSNAFLGRRRSLSAGLPNLGKRSIGSRAYDPDLFAVFLRTTGAIDALEDLDLLTPGDICSIKGRSGYRRFLDAYFDLCDAAGDLAGECDRIRLYEGRLRREASRERGVIAIACTLFAGVVASDPARQVIEWIDDPSMNVLRDALLGVASVSALWELLAVGEFLKPSDSRKRAGLPIRMALSVEGKIAPVSQFARRVRAAIDNRK